MLRLIPLLLASATGAPTEPRVEHVFIVSIDGGKPEVMRKSRMPVLFALAREGAATWNAQTIFPSFTLVSHTSMLTGVRPGRHGVLWNDWKPKRGTVKVPTVFSLARARGRRTAMFVNKRKFAHLNSPGSLDRYAHEGYTAAKVAAAAGRYIEAHRPNLCFVHFADPDSAGHAHGWGSPQQKKALGDSDRALGVLLGAIRRTGIAGRSVVIVTSDHGGSGRLHGSRSPADMTIPWIIWGAGVRRGHVIDGRVTTYDTAATALWLLGVSVPRGWDGKAVQGAFTRVEQARAQMLSGRLGFVGVP